MCMCALFLLEEENVNIQGRNTFAHMFVIKRTAEHSGQRGRQGRGKEARRQHDMNSE